jgi:hypothetical protein
MPTKRLSFHALTTSAQADEEVSDCGFVGAYGYECALMNEVGNLVRIAWSDGALSESEGVVAISHVRLNPGRITLTLDRTNQQFRSIIPYDEIDITYDNAENRHADLVGVITQMLVVVPECVEVVE